ncbi:hypothetical protein BOH73_23020 [Pseudomonas versuta]|uniref:Uncharacterized protein n=10 Tax=Pseudomonas versuta TaxID=1788301 RepID=A0ABX3E4A9_9PSED|nr:hypothetical protein BOH73_23020 [Pseudomonas versuta]
MITSPEVMAGSYNGSAWNMAWNTPELMSMPHPYTYTTWDRSWLQGLSSANNNTWFNNFMIEFRQM